MKNINIGLFGVGLDTYWPQFEGLKSRLEGYLSSVKELINVNDTNVIDAGLVDTVTKASMANSLFKKGEVDAVFIYITTYALSSTVLPVIRDLGVPVIVLNIQPASKPNYELIESMPDRGDRTGEWLAGCQACSAPEIANVFNRSGVNYKIITGYLGEKFIETEIKEWLEEGHIVLCDRYVDSTYAYQSVQLEGQMEDPLEWLRQLSNFVIKPDRTFLFDIDPEEAISRIKGRKTTRFENAEFLKKVRKRYIDIATEKRFKVLDARKGIEDLVKECVEDIMENDGD